MSLRKLKFHERKLLKKVDFLQWKSDDNVREVKVLRRYHIQKREDYSKYNRIVGHITKLCHRLKALDPADPIRLTMTQQLLAKCYSMGLIPTKSSLSQCAAVTASAFCRRRLPVVMFRLKMAESIREAVKLVEQGHVRVGPQVVTDPAFLVTRTMEDHVTWIDTSKIKAKIDDYSGRHDDFERQGN